jgi:hypothetical protein
MLQNQELISYENLFEKLNTRERGIECIGFSGSEKAYLISKIYLQLKASILVIVSSAKEGERLMEDLVFFTGNPEAADPFFSALQYFAF